MTPATTKKPTRYHVRLEAPDDSGHFRETTIATDTPEAAVAYCEQKEREICAFQLSPTDLAALHEEEQAADGGLKGRSKGLLHAHNQTEPYTVVSVKEA